jgi:adenosylcobinamide kinase/adenosylcobinamide-phosphate guanylyltransferase
MGHIVLITGGSRSGKSTLAQRMAESLPAPRVFVATCPIFDDDEMKERIRRHQTTRAETGWATVEEETEVAAAIARAPGTGVFLVDCLTLWVNNLMRRADEAGVEMTDDDAVREMEAVTRAARAVDGTAILVTNEVAMGIVPGDPVSRAYRDFVGRINQTAAAAADLVVLTVCGLPLVIKGADHSLAGLVGPAPDVATDRPADPPVGGRGAGDGRPRGGRR